MRISRTLRVAILAVLLAAGVAPVAPAGAAIIQIRDGNGGNVFGAAGSKALTIGVDIGSGLQRIGVRAGAFYLQYTTASAPHAWTDFVTYCMEPDELLNVAGIVRGDLRTNLGQTAEYGASASALGRLVGSWFADSLTSAIKTAAFQVALWELAFDRGRDLGRGTFQLPGSDATTRSVRTQAEWYLTNWTATASPGVILRNGSQDLLMPPAAVPEPAAIALLGFGLFALAIVIGRRRRA